MRPTGPPVAVVALLDPAVDRRPLAAAFEEEGVPLAFEAGTGPAAVLAAEAARRSALGLGVGGDERSLVLALAAAPGRAYLAAAADEGRAFGRAAARLAARRPLGAP